MPTGYTHAVQTGKITELSDFAMSCAKAFGALITMRDDPADTPIPERFEPNTKYNDEEIERAGLLLDEVIGLLPNECEQRSQGEYAEAVARHNERLSRCADEEDRYTAMLEKVKVWAPPESLRGLHDFMIEQLAGSIKFDCGHEPDPPVLLTGENWRQAKMEKAGRDLAYHTEARGKEISRIRERNEWLDDLRRALASPKATTPEA